MSTGRISHYDEGRGFGFIIPDDGGADVFVHANYLVNADFLRKDQKVSFSLPAYEIGERFHFLVMDGPLGPVGVNLVAGCDQQAVVRSTAASEALLAAPRRCDRPFCSPDGY